MSAKSLDEIPVEVRAQVEASALFCSLRRGDLASAAQAQERLKALGWFLTREEPRPPRRRAPKRRAVSA